MATPIPEEFPAPKRAGVLFRAIGTVEDRLGRRNAILAAAGVALVMLCAVGWFIVFSSVDEASASAESADLPKLDSDTWTGSFTEHTVGRFSASNYNSGEKSVDIHISVDVLVPAEWAERIGMLVKSHEARIREATVSALRLATAEQLNDPNLTDLRKSLCEAINSTIGKECVYDVLVTDFRAMRIEPLQF